MQIQSGALRKCDLEGCAVRSSGNERDIRADLAGEELADRESESGAAGPTAAAGLEKIRPDRFRDSGAVVACIRESVTVARACFATAAVAFKNRARSPQARR